MKNFLKATGYAAMAMAVAGCNSDTISLENNSHEEYVKNFINEFGIPDPDHNYAMAKSAGLHVTTKKGGHVTVTAMVGDTEYLFADLDVPAGTHALPVTIPASVSQLTVKTNYGIQTVATDATVDMDKAPETSRATARGEFPVLYGGEYNIYDPTNDGDMVMMPVENDPPYLYLGFGASAVTKKFFIDKVLASIGQVNTKYTYTLNTPDESKGEVLRLDPNNPAPHETVLTCQGLASYYIFPIYWKKDAAGYKDYEIVLHKVSEGLNDLKNPHIIAFADEGTDKSGSPFPNLGYAETAVNSHNPYYLYPYGDHTTDVGALANYTRDWSLIKFGGYDDMAYDRNKVQDLISRGIKINMSSTSSYVPAVAIAVRSRFSDGKPASFVSSSPFYNTHPDAWGDNYYDAPLHNLYLAASATLRWDTGLTNDTDQLDPFIMDKKIDTTKKSHNGETGTRPDSVSSNLTGIWDSRNQWGKMRSNQAMLLGFSTQPYAPASTDLRDYCDVILLITPHYKITKWGADYLGSYFRHLFTKLPDPMVWTQAAEDLGGSDDWDFNDVVFTFTDVITNLKSENWLNSQAMISGPNGAQSVRTITITPLATGGTMPIYITLTAKGILERVPDMMKDGDTMFSTANDALKTAMGQTGDTQTHTYIIGKEVHKWLGASSYKDFVNVGGSRQNINAQSVNVVIPTDYDIGDETYLGQQAGPSQDNKPLYGFAVLVDKDNTLGYDAFANGGNGILQVDDLTLGEGTYLIGAPDDNEEVNVPQMILVQGDWQWPTERTRITEAYPYFVDWVSDHTNSSWINTPEAGKVTQK